MEKFQIYNRKLNTWEDDNIELVSGWQENFVLDKTTDTAKVKLKYKSLQVPEWKKGDWCRILHLKNSGEKASYKYEKVVFRKQKVKDFLNVQITQLDLQGNAGSRISFDNASLVTQTTFKGDLSGVIKIYYLEETTAEIQEKTQILDFEILQGDYVWQFGFSNTADKSYMIYDYQFESLSVETINETQDVYIPINHEQYVISNITITEDILNGEADIQLDLQEPIEVTKGILCETMSFTNQIEKNVDGVSYKHDALSHYSVLEKILKVTPANNDVYPLNKLNYRKNNKSWFNRIKLCDYDLLNNIPFNDETYNEPSLHEILLNKYDSSVGRTPVLYFDINGEEDKPFNVDRDEYILRFERQDGFDKEVIDFDNLLSNSKELIVNKSSENFTDGLVSNYDNLAPNNETFYFAENLWAIPEVNTNERDLTQFTQKDGKWIIRTPHAIKKILSIKKVYSDGLLRAIKNYDNLIFEERQYRASKYFEKGVAVWYKEGDNIIHLDDMYYKGSDTIVGKIDVFNVKYEPLISARFDLCKDYQTPINQIDSQIDNEKFGQYLKQYFSSMNKSDYIITKTVSDWDDIGEVGTRILKDNRYFIITNISIQNRGFDYDVVYQLNENHIRRSDVIQAPREIRKNIEISVDATKERKTMLSYDCKISLKPIQQNTVFKKELLFSSLLNNYDSKKHIQLAYLTLKSNNPFVSSGDLSKTFNLLCEISRYYINNTICFNTRYIDNAEAGRAKNLSKQGVFETLGYEKYGSPEFQIPVLYTDIFGEFNTFDIKFIIAGEDNVYNYIYNQKMENPDSPLDLSLEQTKSYFGLAEKLAKYPLSTSVENEFLTNPIAQINGINYFKDMLDTFNFTVGVNYSSDYNIILCANFFKNNILIDNIDRKITQVKVYDKNIQENDFGFTKEVDTAEITSVAFENNKISINLSKSFNNIKSIAVIDETSKAVIIINDYDKIVSGGFNKIELYC